MIKRQILILFLVFASQHLFGQRFSSDLWHTGHAITVDYDTIFGKIKYNLKENYITVNSQEKFIAISHQKLFKFMIRDENNKALRSFYSLPYKINSGKKPYIIFEILLEAPETLMAREKIVTDYAQTPPYYSPGLFYNAQSKVSYDMYFLDQKGGILAFDGKRKSFLRYVGNKYSVKMKDFMKSEKLRVDKRDDLIALFRYFNKIKFGAE